VGSNNSNKGHSKPVVTYKSEANKTEVEGRHGYENGTEWKSRHIYSDTGSWNVIVAMQRNMEGWGDKGKVNMPLRGPCVQSGGQEG